MEGGVIFARSVSAWRLHIGVHRICRHWRRNYTRGTHHRRSPFDELAPSCCILWSPISTLRVTAYPHKYPDMN